MKADIQEEIDIVCGANPDTPMWQIPRTDFKILAACAIEEMRVNPDLTISRVRVNSIHCDFASNLHDLGVFSIATSDHVVERESRP